MATKNHASHADELRPEYDLTALTGRVRGKYFTQATAGTTLVLLEPDVAEAFPSGRAVNRALRMYLRGERGKLPNTYQPSPRQERRSLPSGGPRKPKRRR